MGGRALGCMRQRKAWSEFEQTDSAAVFGKTNRDGCVKSGNAGFDTLPELLFHLKLAALPLLVFHEGNDVSEAVGAVGLHNISLGTQITGVELHPFGDQLDPAAPVADMHGIVYRVLHDI